MHSNNHRLKTLPDGVSEIIFYQIKLNYITGNKTFNLKLGLRSLFLNFSAIDTVSGWCERILPNDRESYSLNLLQACEADFLISAYRLQQKNCETQWVIDYGEVEENGNISGALMLIEDIDCAARIMQKWVTQ